MSEFEKNSMRLIEAFIFAADAPVLESTLKKIVSKDINLKETMRKLQKDYSEKGVTLVKVGNSWTFRTAIDISKILNREVTKRRPPSRAATEVLAIIAYHQPITRAEIEEVRGVGLSKGTLDFLFALKWISPRGRKMSPGRPVLWVTTDEFLNHFGLAKISDLPGIEDLKAAGLLELGPSISLFGGPSDLSMSEERAPADNMGENSDSNLKKIHEINRENMVERDE